MPDIVKRIQDVITQKKCITGLDIGCGSFSVLTKLRPALQSTGIDVYGPAIDEGKIRDLHDKFILGDVMTHDFEGQRYDVVIANEFIEHLNKEDGWRLLSRLEALASKLIIITTPNGFLPQGPEFGNQWQIHKSGWFVNDFTGLGFEVRGTYGPKFMRGYANEFKWRGSRLWTPVSELLGSLLVPWPHFHAGLLAIKDMEGIPAQLK